MVFNKQKGFYLALVLVFIVGSPSLLLAGEHGGKEHGGINVKRAPSKAKIRNTMKNHVVDQSKNSGTFDVVDPDTGNLRKLELMKVHKRVGKTGEYFYSCADFKDAETGEMLDLDLDVENTDGDLHVVDVRIHKLEGEPRYTYDNNDNRIPLMETKSHLGKALKEKGSIEEINKAKEHAGEALEGKEHAGDIFEAKHETEEMIGGKEHGGDPHGIKEHAGEALQIIEHGGEALDF
ncbi:hypothetical protein ACFL49_02610 [Candidatus Omnitrophota bacterium]